MTDRNNKFINSILCYLKNKNVNYNIIFEYYFCNIYKGNADDDFYKSFDYNKNNEEYRYKNNDKIIDKYELYELYEHFMIKKISNRYSIEYNDIRCVGLDY